MVKAHGQGCRSWWAQDAGRLRLASGSSGRDGRSTLNRVRGQPEGLAKNLETPNTPTAKTAITIRVPLLTALAVPLLGVSGKLRGWGEILETPNTPTAKAAITLLTV